MLKKILIVLAILIIAFLVVVALQPSEFRVARSVTIAAPPDAAEVERLLRQRLELARAA